MKDTFLYRCYLAILCWVPLPLGSKSDAAQTLLAFLIGLLALSACSAWLSTDSQKRVVPRAFRKAVPVYILLGLYLCWQFFQMAPLRQEWLQFLSPMRSRLIGENDALATLSFHPAATWHRVLLGIAYLELFALTLLLVNSSARLKTLLFTIISIATIQALYGSVMTLSGWETELWFHKEAHIGYATGTLLNRNHLADYLTYGTACGIGLLLSYPSSGSLRTWRTTARTIIGWLLGSGAYIRISMIIMVIGLILTRSRMGTTAFMGGVTIAFFIMLILTRKINRKSLILFGSMLAIDLLLMGSWFGVDKVVDRIENTNTEHELRSQMLPYAQTMAKDFWLSGTGAGTFADTFTTYKKTMTLVWFNEAHCDYLQFLIENGLIGSTLLVLVVLLGFYKALQTLLVRHNPLLVAVAFSIVMVLSAVSIHISVEYLLQRPPTASLFMVFLALPWITASLGTERSKRVRNNGIPASQ